MMTKHEALQRAIEKAGGQAALGRICGKRQGTVWYWVKYETGLPAEFVGPVGEATGIPAHALRPDIFPPPAAAAPAQPETQGV